MTAPFCDFISATVPEDEWHDLRREVSAELDALGMAVDFDRDKETLWRDPHGDGTVKAKSINGVRAISATGAVCAGLRVAGRFASFLAAIASRPHRVTRLDASLDVVEDAPPALDAAVEKGRAGHVALTRKAVRPRDVTTFYGVRADGRVSGTAYFGTVNADVRLCMYDKQHERVSRGLPDVGPLTRYEMRLRSGCGITMRDAHDPAPVFWHFMPDEILSSPVGVVEWVAGGSGFDFERAAPLSPVERLYRRIDDSPEVIALMRLAVEVGPQGFDVAVSRMRKVHARFAELSS